ncbi:MAG: phosphotransferase family protein [Variovorax sp.]|nr:MAG: phosphotransferase family protein [Variovorax sp.]
MNHAATQADFDTARLTEWMRTHVEGFEGPIALERFAGGQSNPTYRVRTPGANYVLRRKPFGATLPGAHAVDREARIMSALAATDVPVPRIHGLCTDDSVIGSWFLVCEMVEGRIFWSSLFPEVPREERHAYMDAMNAALASLHAVDAQAVGLGGLGKAAGYLPRQLARWSRQYREDTLAGRNDAMDRLIDWLERHVPGEDEAAIIHGDFRADNMIFHPHEPRVLAVLDWELSTLGHPLADFAYHAMMFRLPGDILGGLAGTDLAAQGLPDEGAYVQAYCRRTGRDGIADLDYYIAFNMFRFAAILHGIRGRALRGTAAHAQAADTGAQFERVAQIGWAQAQRGAQGISLTPA